MIIWSNLYSVGIEEIDEQHKRFFDLINGVSTARSSGDAIVRLPHLLKELTTYAEFHFANEEKYFDLFKYERATAHIAEHRGYEQKVKEMWEAYKRDEEGVIMNLAEFMEDWLTKHISYSDKLYRKCFKEHGLK